ncbi:hypothetical protein [Streptomyces sp. NPDC057554]|uniref:hypothetical protein n=1 Tax=Streptomyces sp. NPDC057554 TaxID=3350538 RepID=UPI0036AB0B5D
MSGAQATRTLAPNQQTGTTLPLTFVPQLPPRRPGRPRGSTWGTKEAAELKANPGQWAEFKVTDLTPKQISSRAGIIRSKRGSWTADAGYLFQAAIRTDRETKTQRLYGRYVSERQVEMEQAQSDAA